VTGVTLKTSTIKRSAMLSDDRLFRYRLTRSWADGDRVCFVMLNPSTADALTDDATIRRCMQYAWDWSYSGIEVVNLFAYRATDPSELVTAADPVGPANNVSIRLASRTCALTVAAWGGNVPPLRRPRILKVLTILDATVGQQLCVLGLNADNSPKHPLYLRRDLKPVEWGA
jgi:hypothetical protein